MTAEEVTIWLYDYFSSENGFVVLIDPLTNVLDEPTEQMSDAQLTAFACYHIPWKPEGATREDFNEVARKYFGREIENFDNGITFPAKDGSDQLDGVSFSFDSSVYMLLKSLTEENGVYSGTFYCLNVSDSHWEGAPGESQKAREELLSGDVSSFEDTPVWLVQVDFEVKEDEAGETYLLYRDVDILETDVKDIVLYQGAS